LGPVIWFFCIFATVWQNFPVDRKRLGPVSNVLF
jgi:hypothetical protein